VTADEMKTLVLALAPTVRDYVARKATEVAAPLVERLAALEARPAPRDGRDGRDGANGVDGATGAAGLDGLGFGDLELLHDGERRLTVRAVQGDRVKELGVVVFPCEIYRDVWGAQKTYERGDCVTYSGSEWHCNATTTAKPGDGSAAWTLKVKRGRDGRDASSAMGARH
jgi:integrin beta 3